MDTTTFRALRITEAEDKTYHRSIETRNIADLPEGEVLIRVHYAALNYKDALSASGNKGVTRKFPHTPGIDGAGLVARSTHADFKEGDAVLVTSYDLGMNTDGAFSEYIQVPAEWVVPLPTGMSLKESMIIGTAGLTAGIGLYKMEQLGQHPGMGPIVVTGSTGGVGSMAVGVLAKAGYEVIASTGKADAAPYLTRLGAKEVVDRAFVDDDSGRPLLRPKWAGGIDTVGGNTLATLLKGCSKEGSIAACGLVGSPKLSMTVFPFILNGVNLLGMDSATFAMPKRREVWNRLASDWLVDDLESLATTCRLEELNPYIDQILKGGIKGRVIVDLT
ncbi:MAG: YhdH/YhfP family quinone oxidoreductase [Bacteroidota bacterium]